MLSDEALALAGITWTDVRVKLDQWIAANPAHQYHTQVKQFSDTGFERKSFDLKEIRNILVGIISNKPWEVLVGQAIASATAHHGNITEGSILDYLGGKVRQHILDLRNDPE